jgi:alkylation response protein AidB-like acyl-CoA dehydrogenase
LQYLLGLDSACAYSGGKNDDQRDRLSMANIPNRLPGLDFDLGETADMLRDQVAAFSAAEIAPRAADIDKTNDFRRSLA